MSQQPHYGQSPYPQQGQGAPAHSPPHADDDYPQKQPQQQQQHGRNDPSYGFGQGPPPQGNGYAQNPYPDQAPQPVVAGVVVDQFSRTALPAMVDPAEVHDANGIKQMDYRPMNTGLLICCVIGLILTVGDGISVILAFSVYNLVVFLILAAITAGLSWAAHRERIEFDDPQKVFRIARLRLFFVLCDRWDTLFQCDYSKLGAPYAEGGPSANGLVIGTVYLPLEGHALGDRFPLKAQSYRSYEDQQEHLAKWTGFLNRRRESSLTGHIAGAIGNIMHHPV